MIELTFVTGGDLVKFRIKNKQIEFSGKPTNYSFVRWNPIMPENKLLKLKKKKGDVWYQGYVEDQNKFNNMFSDEEVAQDLITDFQKRGLRLVKKIEK